MNSVFCNYYKPSAFSVQKASDAILKQYNKY